MKAFSALAAILAGTITCQTAQAETYRCTFSREFIVKRFGENEDKTDPHNGRDFFIALSERSGKITYCAKDHCGKYTDIGSVSRYGGTPQIKSINVSFIAGAEGQLAQLWSIEGQSGSREYTAVFTYILGQSSGTFFGACTLFAE